MNQNEFESLPLKSKYLNHTDEELHALRVEATRARLARDFHIESEYVGVPKLSKIIGIAPSTIYGYMRRGEFFMPYRMFNTTPMLSLDDIAAWHCAPAGDQTMVVRSPTAASGREPKAKAVMVDRDARANVLVQETLRQMGLTPARKARPSLGQK